MVVSRSSRRMSTSDLYAFSGGSAADEHGFNDDGVSLDENDDPPAGQMVKRILRSLLR